MRRTCSLHSCRVQTVSCQGSHGCQAASGLEYLKAFPQKEPPGWQRARHTPWLCFVSCLGFSSSQAWGQNLSIFPKEEILLVGGDFRLRSVNSNIAGASLLGGGESGGFPTQDGDTKSFFDTRLRLYWDFRPSDLLRVHYRMEIGDVRFGGGTEDGSDVTGNLVPVHWAWLWGRSWRGWRERRDQEHFYGIRHAFPAGSEFSWRHLWLWRSLRFQYHRRRFCRLSTVL